MNLLTRFAGARCVGACMPRPRRFGGDGPFVPAPKRRVRNVAHGALALASFALAIVTGAAGVASAAVTRAHEASVPAAPGAPDGRALVHYAQTFLGVPYVWGGQTPRGFDCSGFVAQIYAHHGYRLPRVSRGQALIGTAIHTLPLQPGDLLFFAEIPGSTRVTHVAMSIGGTRFIHAALGKGEVTYDSLDETYYARRWLGARRVLDLVPGNYATAEGIAPQGAALSAQAPIARDTRAQKVPKDMVQEHPDASASRLLARPEGRAVVFESDDDPFGAALLLPQETGAGMRFGSARLLERHALYLQPEARYFGHATSLQVDVAAPFLWPLSGEGRHLPGRGVSWHTARDWGRLLRTLTVGRRDARLFFGLERAVAITMGDGATLRHFTPNAQSAALEDLLAQPSALSATAMAQTNGLELSWTLDDVFAPRVTGLHLRQVANGRARSFFARHFGASVGYALDAKAPYRELLVPSQPTLSRAVHLGELGLSYLITDAKPLVARTYAVWGWRLTGRHPVRAAGGITLGLLASLLGEGGVAGQAHHLSLRLEARFGGPGWRANYMPFAYAQNRSDMPYRNAGGSTVQGEMPQLTLLLAQRDQPRHVSGLAELTYAYGSRFALGVSYEDGGSMGAEAPGPVPVDRNVTAFLLARNVPLGLGGRTLRGRLLWHWSAVDRLWPLVDATRPHSFGLAVLRADILSWLDCGVSVRKPLGHGDHPSRAFVGTADLSAHFVY